MTAERISIAEFHARCKAQGVSAVQHVATKCPVCGTVQSMASLIKAGAPADRVENLIGFSCEGRFSGAGAWDSKNKARTAARGCDWTLGGLLRVHRLTVVDESGEEHPRFELATPEEARALEAQMATKAAA